MVTFVFTKRQNIQSPNFNYLQYHRSYPQITINLNDSAWIQHYLRDIIVLQLCCTFIKTYPECIVLNPCMSCRFWPWLLSFMKTNNIPYGGTKIEDYYDESLHLINIACSTSQQQFIEQNVLDLNKKEIVSDLSELNNIFRYMLASGIVPSNVIDTSVYPKDMQIIKLKIFAATRGSTGILFNVKNETYFFDGIFYKYKAHADVINAIPNCAWVGVLLDSMFYVTGVTYSSTDSMANLIKYIVSNEQCLKYKPEAVGIGYVFKYGGLKILFPRIFQPDMTQPQIDKSIIMCKEIKDQTFVSKYIYTSIDEVQTGV